jgi:phospholipid-binding lipoprotein MlaA
MKSCRVKTFLKNSRVFLAGVLACSAVLCVLAAPVQAQVKDPLESMNRGIFWFNDTLDQYVVEPVARGYNTVVPDAIQDRVGDFFTNIKTPVYLVSDLVQLKFQKAGKHLGRFVINSTLGGLGLVDVAKSFGLKHEPADFGLGLGYQGVPEGPYIVIPILGPSNVRDLCGRIVDGFLNPVNYATLVFDSGTEISYGAAVLEGIDERANLLEAVESAKEASVDYYSFVKNSYHQHRQNLIYDNNPPEEETDADSINPEGAE